MPPRRAPSNWIEPGRGAFGEGRRAGGGGRLRRGRGRDQRRHCGSIRILSTYCGRPAACAIMSAATPRPRHIGKRSSAGSRPDFAIGGLLITCYTALGDAPNVKRVASGRWSEPRRSSQSMRQRFCDGGDVQCLLYLGQTDRAKEWAQACRADRPGQSVMRYNLACDLIVEPERVRHGARHAGPVLQPHRTRPAGVAAIRSGPGCDARDPRFCAWSSGGDSPRERLTHSTSDLQARGTSRAITAGGRRHHDR